MPDLKQTIQRYLLGEMTEGEREALEQEYFNDRQLFDQIVQVENELVDKYARGHLPPATRGQFEKYYLGHPKRRERARFAEALAAKLETTVVAVPPVTQSWWDRLLMSMRGPKLALAFSVAVLLVAVLAWSLIETRRLRQELARTEVERTIGEQQERELQEQLANERLRASQLSSEFERLQTEEHASASSTSPTKVQPSFATLMLTIGGTRGADAGPPAVITIPSGTEQVRFQLNLRENDYSSYRAALQPAGGAETFAWRRLIPMTTRAGSSLTLVIPAGRFANGDYILTLRGVSKTGEVEDVSKSLFRVERK